MQAFPHRYRSFAQGAPDGEVATGAEGAPVLATQAPPEFGGPPGYWTPETLLTASIADCYVLSFRAAARASRLDWQQLSVDVEGVLDRVEGVTRFTAFTVAPRLRLAPGASETLARAVLAKAKSLCLVTNSLSAPCELQPQIETQAAAA